MAKKPPSPPQNPIPPEDNFILQEFNKAVQQADLPIKVGDGTDLGDIAKRALNKTAEGKDLPSIVTETLDETPQSPSVQTAKVMTGGERAQAAMRKAEKDIQSEYCEDLSRRDFLGYLGSCVLGGLFGGVITFIGDQAGLLNGAKNFIRDAMKRGPTGRFVDRPAESVLGPRSEIGDVGIAEGEIIGWGEVISTGYNARGFIGYNAIIDRPDVRVSAPLERYVQYFQFLDTRRFSYGGKNLTFEDVRKEYASRATSMRVRGEKVNSHVSEYVGGGYTGRETQIDLIDVSQILNVKLG